jgi:hypothetical protein
MATLAENAPEMAGSSSHSGLLPEPHCDLEGTCSTLTKYTAASTSSRHRLTILHVQHEPSDYSLLSRISAHQARHVPALPRALVPGTGNSTDGSASAPVELKANFTKLAKVPITPFLPVLQPKRRGVSVTQLLAQAAERSPAGTRELHPCRESTVMTMSSVMSMDAGS